MVLGVFILGVQFVLVLMYKFYFFKLIWFLSVYQIIFYLIMLKDWYKL